MGGGSAPQLLLRFYASATTLLALRTKRIRFIGVVDWVHGFTSSVLLSAFSFL